MQAAATPARTPLALRAWPPAALRWVSLATVLIVASLSGCGVPQIPPPENVAAPPADAIVLESGLAYIVLAEGTGSTPLETDTVRVHYTGWTTDGKTFDSSVPSGEPLEFPLRAVIAGWTEGLQHMNEGAKHRLWIPEALAYKGQKGKPAGMLVFDVELLEIK